jgi:hypothetical protein
MTGGNNATEEISYPFSLSVWFWKNINSGSNGMFGRSYGSTTGITNCSCGLWDYSGTPALGLYVAGGNASIVAPYPTITLGAWHHMVGTNDGATASLYYDGVIAASEAKTGAVQWTATNNWWLGVELATSSSTLNPSGYPGMVALPRIYNVALTAAQVQAQYQAMMGRF